MRWPLRRARKLDELKEPAGDLPDRVGEAVEVGGLGDIGGRSWGLGEAFGPAQELHGLVAVAHRVQADGRTQTARTPP
jgi:hypothetical protein